MNVSASDERLELLQPLLTSRVNYVLFIPAQPSFTPERFETFWPVSCRQRWGARWAGQEELRVKTAARGILTPPSVEVARRLSLLVGVNVCQSGAHPARHLRAAALLVVDTREFDLHHSNADPKPLLTREASSFWGPSLDSGTRAT